jgi:heme-degrading monooxygenase HmoA
MIKRIVKMEFKPEQVQRFLHIFKMKKDLIKGTGGCRHLELLRVKGESNIFFTLSIWESERALEKYRKSDLFKVTWRDTKLLFQAKPIAWTTESELEV